MQNHVKLEVAIELITKKIADLMKKNDNYENGEFNNELAALMADKEKIYQGDWEAVDKILLESRSINERKQGSKLSEYSNEK